MWERRESIIDPIPILGLLPETLHLNPFGF